MAKKRLRFHALFRMISDYQSVTKSTVAASRRRAEKRRTIPGQPGDVFFVLSHGPGKQNHHGDTHLDTVLLEEIIALVIHEDECREVLDTDFPDSLHSEVRILYALD